MVGDLKPFKVKAGSRHKLSLYITCILSSVVPVVSLDTQNPLMDRFLPCCLRPSLCASIPAIRRFRDAMETSFQAIWDFRADIFWLADFNAS